MIGNLLRELRERKGLTQVELAEILNISQTTLSGYETNHSNPNFDMIEKIANECDYEIVFRKQKNRPELTVESINNPVM